MRLLILTPGFPSASDPVAGVFIKRIAECLVRQGVHVTVINPVAWIPLPGFMLPESLRNRKTIPEVEPTDSGIMVYRPRYFSYPKSTVWGVAHWFIERAVLKTIKKYKLPFDLIHGQWLYPAGLVATRLGKRLGIPVCNTMRGRDLVEYARTRWGRKRIKTTLLNSDHLTSVSQALAREAKHLADVPIKFLPNGTILKTDSGKVDRQLLRNRLNLHPDAFCVLFVGAIAKAKGINELIQVAKLLRNPKLQFIVIGYRLAGSGEIELPEEMNFLGPKKHHEVMEYMQASDVLVLPSYSEGMPNVVVEASAWGLPVIATDVGGVSELIDHSSGYLIPARSATDLQQAIEQVQNDYPAALQKAQRARQRVALAYDMEVNAGTLKADYEWLIRKNQTQ